MEISKRDNFKDDEYLMEEALQKTRRQLISLLEEDECLQCLRTSRCCCPAPSHPQDLQVYQLFDYGIYSQTYHNPPPASKVPKPYWIHGNWVPNDDLARAWMEIRAENLNQSWERAKASTDMIPTAKSSSTEAARKLFRDKINSWFDAAESQEEKVCAKVKDDKIESAVLPPAWPPIKQSPWCQMTEKHQETKIEANSSVAAFFQKFSTPKPTPVVAQNLTQGIFLPVAPPIVATRMNIAYNGLSFAANGVAAIGMMMSYAV